VRSAEEFGIAHCFEVFLPKPNLMIDDQLVADWKFCLEVHPLSIKNANIEAYWLEIKNH
jgi:hypothetical protein